MINYSLPLPTHFVVSFFLFVCWVPVDGMLSHSHTVLAVCMKRSQRRCATWPLPERTAPLMVRKTRTHKVLFLRTTNLYVALGLRTPSPPRMLDQFGEKWRVGFGMIWISLSHLIWAVVDEGDIFNSKAFPDILTSYGESASQTFEMYSEFLIRKNMMASPQSSWILESCGVGCHYTKEVSRWFGNRWYSGYIPSMTCQRSAKHTYATRFAGKNWNSS